MSKATEAGYDMPKEAKALDALKKEVDSLSWDNLKLAVIMPDLLKSEAASMILSAISSYNSGLISDIEASRIVYSLLGARDIDELISLLYGDDYQGNQGAGDDPAAQQKNINDLSAKIDAMNKAKADAAAPVSGNAKDKGEKE